ncbi:MAG: hypothetical protein RL059_312 [Bacteroidota bacterium]|jgi:hypothetical protein
MLVIKRELEVPNSNFEILTPVFFWLPQEITDCVLNKFSQRFGLLIFKL